METQSFLYWSSIKNREQGDGSTLHLVWGDLSYQSPFERASWVSQFFSGQESGEGKANLCKYFLLFFPFTTKSSTTWINSISLASWSKPLCFKENWYHTHPKIKHFSAFGTNWTRLSWPNRLTNKKKLKTSGTCEFAVHRELKPYYFLSCFLRFFSVEMV